MRRVYKNWLVRVGLGFAALTGIRLLSTLFHMTTLEKLYKPRDFRKTSHLEIDQKIIDRLPRHCSDLFGQKMDPINLVFVGDEKQIKDAFTHAGWDGAHPNTPFHWVYVGLAMLFQRNYRKGPFMPLFINIGLQDLAFQKVVGKRKFSERHHIRIWRTRHLVDGQRVWVAAATHETGFKLMIKPPFVVHRMNPSLDYERDYIASDLLDQGSLLITEPELNKPVSLKIAKKNPHGDKFYTDGKAKVIEVR